MKKSLTLLFLLLLPAHVWSQNYGLAVKMTTLGATVETSRTLSNHFRVRLGASFFTYKHDGEDASEDFKYSGDLDLSSFSVLLEVYPMKNSIYLVGGMLINSNEATITFTPQNTYHYGGIAYTPEMLGDMTAVMSFNSIAPYTGIGFGNRIGKKGLGFSMELGVVFQGKPDIELSATKLLEPSATQSEQVEENLEWAQYYPVLSIGLIYTF